MFEDYKYDPLYGVLDESVEVSFFETNFEKQLDRLKGISNLGIIPEIFKRAKYSKHEHALGTTQQIIRLLEVLERQAHKDERPNLLADHRRSLVLASLFLHLGHFPFTYSTERAFLLASTWKGRRWGNRARAHITYIVSTALDQTIDDESKRSSELIAVLAKLRSLKDCREFYKYLGINRLIRARQVLSAEFKGFDSEEFTEVAKSLIDQQNHGYKYLMLADMVDFVQRDALYLGAVKLEISAEHLYRQYSKDRRMIESVPRLIDAEIYEGRLMLAGESYLSDVLYKRDKVPWFTNLYEKIVAFLINHPNFEFSWLEELNDAQFKNTIVGSFDTTYRSAFLPNKWTNLAKNLFDGNYNFQKVFSISQLDYDQDKDIVDLECKLIGVRKGSPAYFSYPFDRGVLLLTHYAASESGILPGFAKFSLELFQEQSRQRLFPLLNVVKQIIPLIEPSGIDELRQGIGDYVSWSDKMEFSNSTIEEKLGEALERLNDQTHESGEFTEAFFDHLSGLMSFAPILMKAFHKKLTEIDLEVLFTPKKLSIQIDKLKLELLIDVILHSPVRYLQQKRVSQFLNKVRGELAEMMQSSKTEELGYIFETLCIVDLILSKRGSFQFFLYRSTIRNPQKRLTENEYDIIEFLIDDGKQARCNVYACSIRATYESDNRTKLMKIVSEIDEKFEDAVVMAYYMIPTNRGSNDWNPAQVGASLL
jgi:hypothetical protein